MGETTRKYSRLVILSTTEVGGFPEVSDVASQGLVINLREMTWSVPRRSSRIIRIGNGDSPAFVMRGEVVGVYRRASLEHIKNLLSDSRTVHVRALGHSAGS